MVEDPSDGARGADWTRYQMLLAHLPVGVLLSRVDGTYLDANDTALRMIGCSSLEELRSRKAGEFYAEPADRERLIAGLLEHGTVRDMVVRSRHPEVAPRWVSITAVLLRSEDGSPESILGITEDVTERHDAQEALARSEARYRSVVETSPDAIALSDLQGWFIEFNRRFSSMFGFESVEEMRRLGLDSSRLVVEEDLPLIMATTEQLYRGEAVVGLEVRVRRRDGAVFPAEFSTGMLRDDAGRPLAYLAMIRDVTERKRAERARLALEEQLRQSHKMEAIGLLAGGVAHDLNNMLTPVLGNGDLLLCDASLTARQRTALEEIVSATKRARDLVRQLMAFGRKQTLDMRALDLNEVVVSFQSLLRRTLRENIRLCLELDPSPCRVRADRGQIEQVLLNLALNAQDAMPVGGPLTLRTRCSWDPSAVCAEASASPGPCVLLSVEDTGHGIRPELLPRVFEPFFTTKETGQGTGLGLATVYGIVRQHGGDIRVDSTPGQGTRFDVLLPRFEGPLQPEAQRPPGEPQVVSGSETILVAEDDPAVRQVATSLLESLGYRVLTAATAFELIELAGHAPGRIDLLLTDVIMPEMGGRELYARLQTLLPGLRVVFMSGHASEIVAGQGEFAPEAGYLQKPFTLESLSSTVRAALAGQPRRGAIGP